MYKDTTRRVTDGEGDRVTAGLEEGCRTHSLVEGLHLDADGTPGQGQRGLEEIRR